MMFSNVTLLTRLHFGAPLDHLSLDGSTSFNDLLQAAYEQILRSKRSITQILKCHQGSLDKRLQFKENVTNLQPIWESDFECGIYLWCIRHFLGLLPNPLFPNCLNRQTYLWHKMAKKCCKDFVGIASLSNSKLTMDISREILCLPTYYIKAIACFLEFLWKLVATVRPKAKYEPSTCYSLVKYFSSSIFLRPFRPGYIDKLDKFYFPLLFYMIKNWKEIVATCDLEKYLFCSNKIERIEQLPLIKLHENISTQTSHLECSPLQNFHNRTFRSVSCQTEPSCWSKHLLNNLKCCCTYGSNYNNMNKNGKSFTEPKTISNNTNEDVTIEPLNFDFLEEMVYEKKRIPCGWVFNNQNNFYPNESSNSLQEAQGLILKKKQNFSEKSFKKDDCEYIYDDYSCFPLDEYSAAKLYSTENISSNNIEKSFSPNSTFNQSANDTSRVSERISKIGWTYITPNKNFKHDDHESSAHIQTNSSPMGWTIPNKDYYTLNYVDMDNKEDVDNNENRSNFALSSTTKLHNWKSVISATKIKAKIDFLKIFSPKKSAVKMSKSWDQVRSNIKYKKMKPSRHSF